jgi:predicted nucleotidyltransferase component of viral defense system
MLSLYISVTSDFGEICIFGKGGTVLVKCHNLIWAVSDYKEDLNLVQWRLSIMA